MSQSFQLTGYVLPVFALRLDGYIANKGRDLALTETIRLNSSRPGFDPITIRITVESNSYAFQACAYSEVWDPNTRKWNPLASILSGAMETPTSPHTATVGGPGVHFWGDRDELLRLSGAILGTFIGSLEAE